MNFNLALLKFKIIVAELVSNKFIKVVNTMRRFWDDRTFGSARLMTNVRGKATNNGEGSAKPEHYG
ncbi:hypothetical protein D3C73_1543570 [compost metagenome]